MFPGSFSSERQFEALLRDGIAAARNESYGLARRLLNRAVRIKPYDARPWLELAKIASTEAEKIAYLEKALAADPYDPLPRRELALLRGKIDADELLPVGGELPQRNERDTVEATAQKTFTCPQCGSAVMFDIQTDTLRCDACGFKSPVEQQRSAGVSEQVLDFVLPTKRGHRWAEAQNRFRCRQCGAVSLWPRGQRALQCPYCGTHQLVESIETTNLVDPISIGVMKIDRQQALQIVRAWLGKGWKSPDDLPQAFGSVSLRPAYYPFWIFDGMLLLHWRCEVNEDNSESPQWFPQTGVEHEGFDDVLVPGYEALDGELLQGIRPFRLKEIVAFEPEFLAGWPALTYDVSLAEAVLKARGEVVSATRRDLYQRVLPGKEKRNLLTGETEWSGVTFNHVLLPIWKGEYVYRGKRFSFMINGQTGEICGEKPLDRVKRAALIAGAILTAVFLVLILLLLLSGQ